MAGIIVAFTKIEDAKNIRNLLVRNGFDVVGACSNGAQALGLAEGMGSGVVVCGYKLADMMYSELFEYLPDGVDMLLAASKARWSECIGNDIVCLALPIRVHELLSTVAMMTAQADRRNRKKKNGSKARSKEEREIIQKAKELLMDRNNMTEEEAHRYLQKCSMDSGNRLAETALMALSLMKM